MEADTEETTMEVTEENDKNTQNWSTSDWEANSNLQNKKKWETIHIKSELDLKMSPSRTDTPDGNNSSDVMDEENLCDDNKDHLKNVLHNGSYQETSKYNVDANTTSDDLRQFDVLDDLDRHPEQNEDSDGDSDTDESMDSDVPDEEIEAMLEEGTYLKL